MGVSYQLWFVLYTLVTMNIAAPDNADIILQVMNKFISLDTDDSKISYKYLDGVLHQLLNSMMNNDVMFKSYYRKIVWAGSYWDNLKVSNPDEYDVDIVMGIPGKHYDIEVFSSKGNPGYVKVKLLKRQSNQATPKVMKGLANQAQCPQKVNDDIIMWEKFVDCNRSLLKNKFRYWFEGVVSKGLNAFPRESDKIWLFHVSVGESKRLCKVSLSKSGPAMTLKVHAEKTFSVDLVPVIELSSWPPAPFCKHHLSKEQQNWFIVPKPKKIKESDDSWRCSFLYHEKKLLHDTLIFKPVLRLIKKFRDRQNLNISSYYIKTIFMWETLEHKDDQTFYRKRQIDLFLHMLSKMKEYFKNGTIPYFWNKQLNLLNDFNGSTCTNIYGKINKILLKIEKNIKNDPSILIKILLTESEEKEFPHHFKGLALEVQAEAQMQEPGNVSFNLSDLFWSVLSFLRIVGPRR